MPRPETAARKAPPISSVSDPPGVETVMQDPGWQMDWKARIVIDPNILVGKPLIMGSRMAVEFVLDLLGQGWSIEKLLEEYDHLSAEDVRACTLLLVHPHGHAVDTKLWKHRESFEPKGVRVILANMGGTIPLEERGPSWRRRKNSGNSGTGPPSAGIYLRKKKERRRFLVIGRSS